MAGLKNGRGQNQVGYTRTLGFVEWYTEKFAAFIELGPVGFMIQLLIWMSCGFYMIPIFYLATCRRTEAVEEGPLVEAETIQGGPMLRMSPENDGSLS